MSLERRALSGTLVGVVAFVMNALSTFLLVPILLDSWGASRYGAWLALQALVTLVATLDFGHQNFVGNELAKLYFSDRPGLRIALASGIWTAAAIGGVELLIALGLGVARLLPLAFGLSADVVATEHLHLALILSTVTWVFAGSVGGLVVRLMPPAGKFVRSSIWGIVYRLCQPAVVAGAALWGLGILGTTLAIQVMTLVYCAALAFDLRKQFADLWPMHRSPSPSVGAQNFARSLVLTGSSTLAQLQQNGLNLIVIGALGAATLPVFSTARTVASTFFQAAAILGAPLAPEMVRFHVNRDYAKLTATFAASWLLGATAVQLGLLASLPLLEPAYLVWTRHALPFDRSLFALLALATAFRMLGSPLLSYLGSVNNLRALASINAVQSATVLVVAVVAMPWLGLRAAGIAVLLGEVVGSCAVPCVFVARELPARWRTRLLHDAALASAPTLVTAAALFSYVRCVNPVAFVPAAFVILVPVLLTQWRRLPPEVRARLVSLVPFLKNPNREATR